MNTDSYPQRSRTLLTSYIRPENWNPVTGCRFLDWEVITNDWFIYTVDWEESGANQSVQLLANRDNRYTIIRSPKYRRESGVFTSRQRRAVKEIWSPANLAAYRSDSLGEFELKFGPKHPVIRLGLWVVPGQQPGNACWGETNLSPATQHLIATFDQLIASVSPGPSWPTRSIFSN